MWAEGQARLEAEALAERCAKHGPKESADAGVEHDAGQTLPADPGAQSAQEPDIALAQPLAPAQATIEPADRGEAENTGEPAGEMIEERRRIDEPIRERAGEAKRERERQRQAIPALVDDGERQKRPAETAARPGDPSRQDHKSPDRNQERRDLDRRIDHGDPPAAIPASGAVDEPADERQKIGDAELVAAPRADRAADQHRARRRLALDHYAEEAADEGRGEQQEEAGIDGEVHASWDSGG